MPYYQRLGKVDRRSMAYGRGRFDPRLYRNYRGAPLFTDIFEIGNGDPGAAILHGRIYDPSELGITPPYPEFIEIEEVWYQFNPNNRPPNRNNPHNPNARIFNGPRDTSNIPIDRQKIDKVDMMKQRNMHGVGHNQIIQGVNPGIYREKDQPSDDYSAKDQPVYEQSSTLSQQLRRGIIKGERLLNSVNQSTGEIEEGGERAFIGDLVENIQGDRDVFFLSPENRPDDGSHKDLD